MTRCDTCGKLLDPGDPAAKVIGRDADADGFTDRIACRNCARRAGVDTGAFCRPVREITG